MSLVRTLRSLACFSLIGAFSLHADPPGALIPVRVQVPASMRSAPFNTDRTLQVPPGFRISVFARVGGARFMAVAPSGDVLVSQPGAGKVVLLRPDAGGGDPKSYDFVTGLRSPHDIVFHAIGDRTYVYISETNQINRFTYNSGDTSAHDRQVVVANLPDSSTPELRGAYGHELKNIALDANHKLYVSIASTCNVCTSDTTSNPVRAAIYQYEADGSGGRLYARGLRNAEGLAILPDTGALWVAVNNRDQIPYPNQDSTGNYGRVMEAYVDNHPPELFTAVRDGGNYGWPFCNSNQDTASGWNDMPLDRDYDFNRNGQVDCSKMDRASKGIQAHSAPLGLSFLQGTAFPAAYRSGAVIGLHGSWNRSTPTGYKVIYFPWNSQTQTPGNQVDLVSGWLTGGGAWGRPVDAVVDKQGALLISDDSSGTVYRLVYQPAIASSASGYATLTAGGLATAYGSNLSSQTVSAASLPLPTSLADTTVLVRDSAGVERNASLVYVSPGQINFVMPDSAAGVAQVTVVSRGARTDLGSTYVTASSPGLFAANANGQGVAAATAVRTIAGNNQVQSDVPVFSCSQGAGNCTAVPIDLGLDTPVFLSLYGTGLGTQDASKVSVRIGDTNVPVLYAGPQGTYPGLEQINVALPLSLRGRGEVGVVVTVGDQSSNEVRIRVQ